MVDDGVLGGRSFVVTHSWWYSKNDAYLGTMLSFLLYLGKLNNDLASLVRTALYQAGWDYDTDRYLLRGTFAAYRKNVGSKLLLLKELRDPEHNVARTFPNHSDSPSCEEKRMKSKIDSWWGCSPFKLQVCIHPDASHFIKDKDPEDDGKSVYKI